MKLLDLQKQIATVTSAALITLGAAVDKYRTVAQGIAAGVIAVGDTGVPFYVRDPATGAYQASYYTITSATVLTLERIARSSNNNQAVAFGGAVCEVFCSVPPDYLEGTSIASVPTVTAVPSGAYALLLSADGTLSKILASIYPGSSNGGTTTPVDNAPTLSALSASATGATTATGSVTTNKAGGTLYWLFSTSATPTKTQVLAGSSKAVTVAGAQALAGTGLTAATNYYLHALHRDSASQDSSVLSLSTPFTTQAATSGPVYQFNGPVFSTWPTSLSFGGGNTVSLSADFKIATAAGVAPEDNGTAVDIYITFSTSSTVVPRPNDAEHAVDPTHTFFGCGRLGVGNPSYAGCYQFASLYTYKNAGGTAPRFPWVVIHAAGANPATATPIWAGVYDGNHTGTPLAITMSA